MQYFIRIFSRKFSFYCKTFILSKSPSLKNKQRSIKKQSEKKVFQLLRRVIMFWHIPPKNVYTWSTFAFKKKKMIRIFIPLGRIISIDIHQNNISEDTQAAPFSYFSSSFVLQNNPSQDVLGKRLLRTWKSFLYRL